MDYSDLPSIGNLLSRRLANVVIPDEDTIGQPFWTIFDIEEYSLFGHIDAKNEIMTAFLFLSRAHAQRFLKGQNLGIKWQVRGMAQRHLSCYILTCDALTQDMSLPGLDMLLACQKISSCSMKSAEKT